MTVPTFDRSAEDRPRPRRAWIVFVIAAALMPIWLVIGGFVSRPDARSLADGPESSWYGPLSLLVILLSFVGCACVSFLSPQTLERKITFAALGIIAFYADATFSWMFVTLMFGFVD